MATYHCSVKRGNKGSGASSAAKTDYICREGEYKDKPDREHSASGNMPEWAQEEPRTFWKAADEYERANARVYSEIEVALPREISPEQRQELVKNFIKEQLGEYHPYSVAIHNPPAALEGGEQPHAHIVFSERKLDGIERSKELFFKRASAKEPEKGGAAKDPTWHDREKVQQIRESWEQHYNRHSPEQVSCRSLKEQGIDREPERHLGPKMARPDSPEAGKVMETREDLKKLEQIEREMAKLSREIEAVRLDQKKQKTTTKRQAEQTRPKTVEDLAQTLACSTREMGPVNKIITRMPGEDEVAHRKRLGIYQQVFERAMSERREILAPRAQVEAELWPERSELARQAERVKQERAVYQNRRDPWEQDGKVDGWKYAPPREGLIARAADYLKSPERKAWDKEGQALTAEECRLNTEGGRTQDNRERVEQEITTDRAGRGGQVYHRQIEAAQRDSRYRQLDTGSQAIAAVCADLDRARLEQEQDKARMQQKLQKQNEDLEQERGQSR